MALKQDREIRGWNINLICDDVHPQGSVLTFSATAGSGSAVADEKAGKAALSSNPSGKVVAGIDIAEFVNIDQTRQHRNFHKTQQVVGEKAALANHGWVTTNLYIGSPTIGAPAYLTSSGYVTPTLHTAGGLVATPLVGRFESIPDEDSYVKLSFNLP